LSPPAACCAGPDSCRPPWPGRRLRWRRTSFSARVASATSGGRIELHLDYVQLTPAATVNAGGWTQLTGTATVSFSGTLTGATLYVGTAAGTDGLYLDDASMQ
jgi:hypothetical protein